MENNEMEENDVEYDMEYGGLDDYETEADEAGVEEFKRLMRIEVETFKRLKKMEDEYSDD